MPLTALWRAQRGSNVSGCELWIHFLFKNSTLPFMIDIAGSAV